jgi:hypothetical protein
MVKCTMCWQHCNVHELFQVKKYWQSYYYLENNDGLVNSANHNYLKKINIVLTLY